MICKNFSVVVVALEMLNTRNIGHTGPSQGLKWPSVNGRQNKTNNRPPLFGVQFQNLTSVNDRQKQSYKQDILLWGEGLQSIVIKWQ